MIEVFTEDGARTMLQVNSIESVQELRGTRTLVVMKSGERHIVGMEYDYLQRLLKKVKQ